MSADKANDSSAARKKKITLVLTVVVLIFLIWQMIGLFGSSGGSSSTPTAVAPRASSDGKSTASTPPSRPPMPTPTAAALPNPAQQPMTERESQLFRLQQETEAKYIMAVNELQMLKLSKEMAETNQAIMAAKLATVTAQKNIVDMLTPPAPPAPTIATAADYAKNLAGKTGGAAPGKDEETAQNIATEYTVLSVTRLRNQWGAVLAYQQNLYNVSVGDVLTPDSSKVVSIDRSGVLLSKDGVRRRLSMVPVI